MPIEIRELVIKSTIVGRPADSIDEMAASAPAQAAHEAALREAILHECGQLVARLLRERGAR